MPVVDGKYVWTHDWVEQGLERLVGAPVPPEVGQDNDTPGPGCRTAAGAAASLDKGSAAARSLVLEDAAHAQVVKADLKRCGGNDNVALFRDANVSRTRAGDRHC